MVIIPRGWFNMCLSERILARTGSAEIPVSSSEQKEERISYPLQFPRTEGSWGREHWVHTTRSCKGGGRWELQQRMGLQFRWWQRWRIATCSSARCQDPSLTQPRTWRSPVQSLPWPEKERSPSAAIGSLTFSRGRLLAGNIVSENPGINPKMLGPNMMPASERIFSWLFAQQSTKWKKDSRYHFRNDHRLLEVLEDFSQQLRQNCNEHELQMNSVIGSVSGLSTGLSAKASLQQEWAWSKFPIRNRSEGYRFVMTLRPQTSRRNW